MQSLFSFINTHKLDLSHEAYETVHRQIARVNFVRVQRLAFVLLTVHLVLLYRDIAVFRAEGYWTRNIGYQHLFTMHIILIAAMLAFLVMSWLIQRVLPARWKIRAGFNAAFAWSVLMWCGVLASWVNQHEHGFITEYIIAIFGVAAAFYFSPLVSFVMFASTQAVFMVVLATMLAKPDQSGHYTNSIAMIAIAWTLAYTSFRQQVRNVMNQQIIQSQSDALELNNVQLLEQNAALETLNHDMQELLQIVAHDLKNPIASLVLSADIVQMSLESEPMTMTIERIARMQDTAMRMNKIVTNILGANAIESGKFELSPEAFPIVQLIEQAVSSFAESAAQKSITIRWNAAGMNGVALSDALLADTILTDVAVVADVQATTEILDNLISNAVKYSPHGKNVFVSLITNQHDIHRLQQQASVPITSDCLLVTVRDEGPGLSEADKTKLFGKFARLSAQPTGGEHSTGLGLSIVKKLTEAMGGRVWCESELGKGATFVLQLPTPSAEARKHS